MSAAVLAALAVATAPVEVAVDITPRSVLFGDAVEARTTIIVDTRAADPDGVAVRLRPGPLTRIAERREWARTGPLAVLRVRARLACRSEACVPDRGARRVLLPPLRVGQREIAWPPLDVLPRVPAAAVEAEEPPWLVDAVPPAPTFRVVPHRATAVLGAGAVLLAAAGLVLLALEARTVLAARPRRTPTPLERALARARASLRAGPGERRRAVGTLARALAPADRRLARDASELAWAEPQPERDAIETLAAQVERELRTR